MSGKLNLRLAIRSQRLLELRCARPIGACTDATSFGDACEYVWSDDNYDLESSHILPALIRKFHTAKMNGEESRVLGDGNAKKRVFIFR